MLSLMKQLGARQQITAVKNVILEYVQVKNKRRIEIEDKQIIWIAFFD